jgi:hypothetical protein
MKPILIAAAAFVSTMSGAALAGETPGTSGIGARQSTTAAVHCDAMTGRERESCLRALHERDKTGAPDPTAGTRTMRESSPPPVKAAPAGPKTPAGAAARAADPKAPTGALIIDTPSGTLPKP